MCKIRVFVWLFEKSSRDKGLSALYFVEKTQYCTKSECLSCPLKNHLQKEDIQHYILSKRRNIAQNWSICLALWKIISKKRTFCIIFCRKWRNCTKLEYLSGPLNQKCRTWWVLDKIWWWSTNLYKIRVFLWSLKHNYRTRGTLAVDNSQTFETRFLSSIL